jgi:hypothetical protein
MLRNSVSLNSTRFLNLLEKVSNSGFDLYIFAKPFKVSWEHLLSKCNSLANHAVPSSPSGSIIYAMSFPLRK